MRPSAEQKLDLLLKLMLRLDPELELKPEFEFQLELWLKLTLGLEREFELELWRSENHTSGTTRRRPPFFRSSEGVFGVEIENFRILKFLKIVISERFKIHLK